MNTCEAKAEEWAQKPQRLAEEFHKWAQWIKEKERGDAENGYRLRVSPSEAEKAQTELRQFSTSLKYFCTDRNGPPSITPSHLDGYLADLERATLVLPNRIFRDEKGAVVLDCEGIPEISQTCLTQQQPEFLKQRLPVSMLAAIEASDLSVHKWASDPEPDKIRVHSFDVEFDIDYMDGGTGGYLKRKGQSLTLPKALNILFKLLRRHHPTRLSREAVSEAVRNEVESEIPSLVQRLRNALQNIGLTVSKAPYCIRKKIDRCHQMTSRMSPHDI